MHLRQVIGKPNLDQEIRSFFAGVQVKDQVGLSPSPYTQSVASAAALSSPRIMRAGAPRASSGPCRRIRLSSGVMHGTAALAIVFATVCLNDARVFLIPSATDCGLLETMTNIVVRAFTYPKNRSTRLLQFTFSILESESGALYGFTSNQLQLTCNFDCQKISFFNLPIVESRSFASPICFIPLKDIQD